MHNNFKKLSYTLCLLTAIAIGTSGLSASATTSENVLSVASVESLVDTSISTNGEASVIVTLADHSVANLDTAKKRSELKNDQEAIAEKADLDKKETTNYSRIPAVATTVDSSQLAELRTDPNVESIRLQRFYKSSELQTGISYSSLMRPSLTDSVILLDADDAWANGTPYTGSGKSVVIIDTGVDSDHDFLSGAVVTERCYAQGPNGIGGVGSCPNGLDSQSGSGAAAPCSSTTSCNHGTHVAGIAAGRTGVSGAPTGGIAPAANIIAIQVFSTFTNANLNWQGQPMCSASGSSSPCILTSDSDVLSALNYVLANKTNVASINLSLGGGGYSTTCDGDSPDVADVITELRNDWGILTLAAAGNDASATNIAWPACISSAVAVGATSKTDTVATTYSNSNSLLDIWAPGGTSTSGGAINSSVPVSLDTDGNPNGYTLKIGTSMATPMITGAVAVLRQAYPSESANQIMTRLQESGVNITDSRNSVSKHRPSLIEAIQAETPMFTELARTVSNSTVYLVNGTSKYTIGNMSLLSDFSVLGPVNYVDQSYLDSFSSGGSLTRVVGSTADASVHLIVAGIRLTFGSCDSVEDYGFSCTGLVKLPPSQLARFSSGPGVTAFLKGTRNATVYFVIDGQKRPIASWGDLVGLGVPFVINKLTDDFVTSIPTGDLLFGGGGLIKSSDSASVYAVNDWSGSPSVYPVTSFNNTVDLGLGTNVRTVSSSLLSQYSVASNLKTTVKCGSDTYVGTIGVLYEIDSSIYSHFNYSVGSFLDGGSICNRFTFSSTQMSRFILNRGSIYYVEDGAKRGFTSYGAYLANGGNPSTTISVSDAFVAQLPNGTPISS